MKYEFDDYITTAQCITLSNADVLYAYKDTHNRRQYVRSGSKWYHNATNYSQYGYDLSNSVCVDVSHLEYEYSFIEPIYQFVSFIVIACAIILAFKLIIGRLFKGGSKW